MMKMRDVASGVKIIHYIKNNAKEILINHAKLSKRRLIKVEKPSINLEKS